MATGHGTTIDFFATDFFAIGWVRLSFPILFPKFEWANSMRTEINERSAVRLASRLLVRLLQDGMLRFRFQMVLILAMVVVGPTSMIGLDPVVVACGLGVAYPATYPQDEPLGADEVAIDAELKSKALRYHQALQRRPAPGFLFDRFVDGLLEFSTLADLEQFLQQQVEANKKTLVQFPGTRLVVIDPVAAYCGKVDSHKNSDVRGMLAPLAEIASRYQVAILTVTHLAKSGGSKAVYRAMGSLAFAAAARAVWAVTKDVNDPQRRLGLSHSSGLS
jgi:hypothetical protein